MTLAVSRAFIMFMVGLDKQTVDTNSSQASGLASRFQESMNVNCGTGVSTTVLVTLHQSVLYFTCFTLLITSYYKIKCIPKFICSWIKVPTK